MIFKGWFHNVPPHLQHRRDINRYNILLRSGHGRGLWAAGGEAAAHGRRNPQQRRRSCTRHLPPPGKSPALPYTVRQNWPITGLFPIRIRMDPPRFGSPVAGSALRMRNPFPDPAAINWREWHWSTDQRYGCRSVSGSDFIFDANPDPNPTPPNFTHVRKAKKLLVLLCTAMAISLRCFIFLLGVIGVIIFNSLDIILNCLEKVLFSCTFLTWILIRIWQNDADLTGSLQFCY